MGFKIINWGTGFQLIFESGVVLSTVFGSGTYSQNRDDDHLMQIPFCGKLFSSDAELAVVGVDGDFITRRVWKEVFSQKLDCDVVGYVRIDDWMKVVDWCRVYDSNLRNKKNKKSKAQITTDVMEKASFKTFWLVHTINFSAGDSGAVWMKEQKSQEEPIRLKDFEDSIPLPGS